MPVNNVTRNNVRWLGGDPTADGVGLGKTATSKVGFYGTTPVVQPASASQAAVTATTTTTATTTALQTDLDAVRVLANQIRSEMVTLGLMTGAA